MIKRIVRAACLPALILLTCLATRANANFQYIPDGSSVAAAADTAPAPLMPAPIARQPLPAAPDMPLAPAPAVPNTKHIKASGGAIINGFGTQVPLVIALRQIVPASYQFAFSDGINLGTLVNWKGGRPWRDVMNSVVTPLGLTATEKDQVIYIGQQ